jgi:alanyl-tRNA synthetase
MLPAMKAAEIRKAFLRFFEERGHRVVHSGPLVPEGDPTLMFANAGMVQFKRVFLGEETRPYARAVTAQKCMRVSGKHNDLEDVGRSARHHSFFEMLGNFSFGDYFKKEAIEFGWEFVTRVLGLAPERLAVTVLHDDDESYALWRDHIGLPESRIYRLGEADNFWQMGDTGPCGPCSEINLITGPPCGRPDCDPTCECGRFLEFWNLVFMQFEQTADGERRPLPKPSVDTGMGLERVARILQGVSTTYDTDVFAPLLAEAARLSGKRYGASPESDVSLRVIADHARACAFLIGDGVLPSNEGRGYVLRRVLRRAARHGVLLGLEEPFLYRVAGVVVDTMGDAYPELRERRAFIEETVRREEERFGKTLGRGLELLDTEIARARREKRASLAGDVVFRLYDTFGFPTDLVEDVLRGHEIGWERARFEELMNEQRERAREAWVGSGATAPAEVWSRVAARATTRFVGYETLRASSRITAIVRDGAEVDRAVEGDRVEVTVEVTPFYAESGGQVGDTGAIRGPQGTLEVEDTQRPVEGVVVHHGRVALGTLAPGDAVELEVDAARRAATVRNHSGTHLLHWALRRVLGPQVSQAGSLVAPDRLRFDFTFERALDDGEVRAIEDLVNDLVLQNVPARVEEKPYAQALREGAVAMFAEKYGDRVRVVGFGPSTELCGGTHARATGDVGMLRITGQSAIGAGVRRIEAQTGLGALEHARRESRALRAAADVLRAAPAELAERVARLLEREKELGREIEKLRAQLRSGGSADPLRQAREVAGVRVVAAEVEDADPRELRALVDELKQRLRSGIVLVGTRHKGKAALALGVTPDLVARFRAGDLVKRLAEVVGGTGGGRPDFAQAGGPDVDRLPEALERLDSLLGA